MESHGHPGTQVIRNQNHRTHNLNVSKGWTNLDIGEAIMGSCIDIMDDCKKNRGVVKWFKK